MGGPQHAGPAPSRRGLLAGVVATATAAGCKPLIQAENPDPDPDVVTIEHVLAAEDALLASYAAATAAHPSLRDPLDAFVHRHRQHREVLHARLPERSASPSPSGPRSPSATPGAPRTVRKTLARLVDAEHAAASDRVQSALDASPTLAELLASIGACEAAHTDLLDRVEP